MNWLNELKRIYEKLEATGYVEIKNEIFDAQLSGGTGGEIFLMVTEKLKKIRSSNPKVYAVIKNEADKILSYGKEIGYLSEG
jgi:hypothetical protein